MPKIPTVITTIASLAEFYGVEPPEGMDPDHLITLWRDEDGWHINAGIWELRDEDWAPRTDGEVQNLLDYLENEGDDA